jgi:hypothetical protein
LDIEQDVLHKLLSVDAQQWIDELPGIKEHFAKFGKRLLLLLFHGMCCSNKIILIIILIIIFIILIIDYYIDYYIDYLDFLINLLLV